MESRKLSEWIGRASVASLLLAILVAGKLGYWVRGTEHNRVLAGKDEWKALALKAVTRVVKDAPRMIGTRGSPTEQGRTSRRR
jgi:hypothetical protein